MPRPGVNQSTVQANAIDWSYFVRVDVASPIGTKRFTDRWSGDTTVSIDGGSQLWSAADLIVGPIDQNAQNPGAISFVDFANLDWQWTTWANSPGLRGAPFKIYVGWFNADGSLNFSYEQYDGSIGSGEFGPRARIALKPPAPWWTRRAPWVTIQQLGFSNLMPRPGDTIHFGGDPVPRVVSSPRPPVTNGPLTPSQQGQNPLADYRGGPVQSGRRPGQR